MIKGVNDLPERWSVKNGKRISDLKKFLDSGEKIGLYQMREGERLTSVYHSFKVAVKVNHLTDRIDVTVRRKEIYFIRRDI